MPAPSRIASSNDGMVFSGRVDEAPRCATTIGNASSGKRWPRAIQTRLEGQRWFTGHTSHLGLRATQTARPWSIRT